MSNPEPWIALTDTPELPISKTAFKEVEVGLNVRNIALPYKRLGKEYNKNEAKSKLSIDLGKISEDWNGDGSLNTEDIPVAGMIGDGLLDDSEDIGLDGCSDEREDGWGGCLEFGGTYNEFLSSGEIELINVGNDIDPNDPNGDNWNYNEGSNDYKSINGTEGNALDAGRYPDTEDLDRTGFLDKANDYFTKTFTLDDTTYFLSLIHI